MRYLLPVMDNGILDGVLAGAGNVGEAEALSRRRRLCPLDLVRLKARKLHAQSLGNSGLVGKIVFDHVVEPPEQGAVQDADMLGGGDDEAVGINLLDPLEENEHERAVCRERWGRTV